MFLSTRIQGHKRTGTGLKTSKMGQPQTAGVFPLSGRKKVLEYSLWGPQIHKALCILVALLFQIISIFFFFYLSDPALISLYSLPIPFSGKEVYFEVSCWHYKPDCFCSSGLSLAIWAGKVGAAGRPSEGDREGSELAPPSSPPCSLPPPWPPQFGERIALAAS